MMMEGERRKRKLENNEEEESEEEKLEKFYALIRSTKDVRDRLAITAKEKDDTITVEKEKGIWKPTFQPEDFIDDYQLNNFPSTHHHHHHHHHHHPSSSKPSLLPSSSTSAKQDNVIVPVAHEQPPPPPPQTEDDVDEKANDPLDLNLSL